MKRQFFAVTLLSAVLLTACGSAPAESVREESSAAETTTEETTAVTTTTAKETTVTTTTTAPTNQFAYADDIFQALYVGMPKKDAEAALKQFGCTWYSEEPGFDKYQPGDIYECGEPISSLGMDANAKITVRYHDSSVVQAYTIRLNMESEDDVRKSGATAQAAMQKRYGSAGGDGTTNPANQGLIIDDIWYEGGQEAAQCLAGINAWGIQTSFVAVYVGDINAGAGLYTLGYSPAPKSGTGGGKKSDSLPDGVYWCMGKNDTCRNKTYDPTDFYCHSCDPDDNNIEGDQRKSSSGKITDRDGNGKVDEDDWEKAWKEYLNDKLN